MRLFEHPDFEQAVLRTAEHFRPFVILPEHRRKGHKIVLNRAEFERTVLQALVL
jgi:hypothetical protein